MSLPFQILGTTETPSAVENLITQANEMLCLVTPYFKPSDRVGTAILAAKVARKVTVIMLLRGGEDQPKQAANAKRYADAGVQVGYLPRLHAKIYLNEHEAILTSMNLYEDSATNSYEVGVRYPKDTSPEAYQAIIQQVQTLAQRAGEEARMAREIPGTGPAPAKGAAAARSALAASGRRPARAAHAGHCIRCDEAIPLNADKPFCPECFASWARFANVDYEEAFCHACGKEGKITAAKPLCKSCWRASAG